MLIVILLVLVLTETNKLGMMSPYKLSMNIPGAKFICDPANGGKAYFLAMSGKLRVCITHDPCMFLC